MARFYKTASANPLDYMFKLNTPLMERVVKANDEYITQNLKQTATLENLASSFPFLQADEGRAKEISDAYAKKIDEASKAIRDDPANWRKQLDPIRDITRDLQQDYKVGEISKIAGNYNQYKQVADAIDKEVENYNKTGKGISADRARAYKEYFLNQFTGKDAKGTNYNSKTGEYNVMKAYSPMANIDIRKMLGEELDKLKADKTKYKKSEVTGEEWYFNDKTQAWEGITPEKVLGIVSDRLRNPQLMDYMRQESQVGLISGVYDDKGNFIAPYMHQGVPISPEEQAQIDAVKANIAKTKDKNVKAQLQSQLDEYENNLKGRKELVWNGDSYLSPILRGLTNQYSYSQTEEGNNLRNNTKGSTKFVQAQTNLRDAANRASREKIAADREAGINDRFDKTMDWNKHKFEHPQAKPGTSTGTKPGTKKEDIPVNSTVSKLSTQSFEDWMTTNKNGEKVKVLSTEGLSADIETKKKEEATTISTISTLDGKMKSLLGNRSINDLNPVEKANYNNLKVQKESYEANLPKIQSDLNQRRAWYKASTEAALGNNEAARKDKDGDLAELLTPEEIKIYNEGEAGMKKRQEEARKYLATANEINLKVAQNGYKTQQERQAAIKLMDSYREKATALGLVPGMTVNTKTKAFDNYYTIKKKVDERRDNFLSQMRYSAIDTDAIKVGKDDSEAIANMIFNNPVGTKLYDSGGNRTDRVYPKGILEGKGISWFNPKGDDYSMTTAQDDSNLFAYIKKNNVKVNIEQVGNTTKIGSGNAVVQVSFDDPTGQIGKKSFYIELTPELQKQIGTRLSTTAKDDGVKTIASSLLDDEANDLRRQLITPTVQQTAGAKGFDPATYNVFVSNGNSKIPFQVTKFVGEDGQVHLNVTGSQNGVQVPLPNTPSGIPGWFNGAEDFMQYIKSQRQKK